MTPGGKTELETAKTPNLDALAHEGVQGGSIPVSRASRPGSGPGHLGLFGYDPLKYVIGRGALEATGIGFELRAGRRGDSRQLLHARRAGQDQRSPRRPHRQRRERPAGHQAAASEDSRRRDVRRAGEGASLCRRLPRRGPGRQRARHRSASHRRAAARARGRRRRQRARRPKWPTEFVDAGTKLLADEPKANGLTLRGFSGKPNLPTLRRSVRPEGRGDCRLSDVQGPGAAGRHGHRRQGQDARRADRRARRELERSTTSSSSTSSTPTAPAKTATSTRR